MDYSMHRYKATESFQIGKPGQYSPVGAYLAIDEILAIAKNRGVDLIHPGNLFTRGKFIKNPTLL